MPVSLRDNWQGRSASRHSEPMQWGLLVELDTKRKIDCAMLR